MKESDLWGEIGNIEHAMLTMHECLDRIIAETDIEAFGCPEIAEAAGQMKQKLDIAFEAKFWLATAISEFYGHHTRKSNSHGLT